MRWFVRNVRDGKWWDYGPQGFVNDIVGDDKAQIGVNLFVLGPGEPMSMYHYEVDQEGFLVLAGEALLIVEDEERMLRQWDYFDCPPNVAHTILGAGFGPAAILAIGARIGSVGPDWGKYPYSELAMKHNASAEEETTDSKVAYARFPEKVEGEYREEWLP